MDVDTPIEVIDEHYLALCAFVTIGIQLACFFIAYVCSFDTITDFSGSTNFIVVALLTLFLNKMYYSRQILLTSLVIASRLELALFLFARVLKRKKDSRFDGMREKFFAFLFFWIFQMFWIYLVSLPVMWVNGEVIQPAELQAADYVGAAIFIVAFLFQAIGDFHKTKFRSNPDNNARICDRGFWAVTRHPNYFGEIMMWWGAFIIAVPSIHDWGYITLLSPLFTMFLLLFLSGIPFAEGKHLKRFYQNPRMKAQWERYRRRVPPLIPFIPALYERMPLILKRILCCEFPMYEYKEEAVGPSTSLDPGSPSPGEQGRE